MANLLPSWECRLYNQNGEAKGVFDSFVSLQINMRRNNVGSFSITFYDDPNDERLWGKTFWQIDSQVYFIRTLPNYMDSNNKLVIPRSVLFYGLVRRRTRSTSESGDRLITYHGFSYEHLLARRVIAALEGTIRAEKEGNADYVMCEYVDENCGPSAGFGLSTEGTPDGTGRAFSPDTSAATTVWYGASGITQGLGIGFPLFPGSGAYWQGVKSFENLLDAIVDISAATRVDFNVVGIGPAQFGFFVSPEYGLGADRTAVGVDPSTGLNGSGYPPVVFDLEHDNVETIENDLDRSSEATRVFVLGKGERSTRSVLPWELLQEVVASPWNTIEVARGASENDFEYQLQRTGNEVLQEARYKEIMTITPRQTEASLFQKNYHLGDRVTGKYGNEARHFRIIEVDIDYKDPTERITLELESPIYSTLGNVPPQQP